MSTSKGHVHDYERTLPIAHGNATQQDYIKPQVSSSKQKEQVQLASKGVPHILFMQHVYRYHSPCPPLVSLSTWLVATAARSEKCAHLFSPSPSLSLPLTSARAASLGVPVSTTIPQVSVYPRRLNLRYVCSDMFLRTAHLLIHLCCKAPVYMIDGAGGNREGLDRTGNKHQQVNCKEYDGKLHVGGALCSRWKEDLRGASALCRHH